MSLSPRARRALCGGGVALLLSVSATAMTPSAASAQPSPPLRDAAALSGTVVGFGVDGELLADADYASLAGYEFSGVALNEEAAWNVIEPVRGGSDWSGPDRVMEFASTYNQWVNGFPLIWGERLPGWLAGLGGEELRYETERHIATAMSRYSQHVYRWDVVVNPLDADGSLRETAHLRAFGEDYIADAFRTARTFAPDAALYISDVGIADEGPKGDAMYELVSSLLAQGVPIDGIGLQGHFEVGEIPSSLPQVLQRYADLGLKVAITDLHVALELAVDAPPTDPALAQQARDYAEVVTACVRVQSCDELTVGAVTDDRDGWGSGDTRRSYYLWDADYTPKSAYFTTLDAFIAAP